MTTYGELVTKAAQCIHEGSARTQHQRFDSIDDAYEALIGYHAVLDAIERHVRSLADPHRVGTVYGVPPGLVTGDPVEYAAVQMVDSIPVLEDKDRRLPYLPGPNGHPWAHAARLLRAGTDLLATHLDPDGFPRTPDAGVVTDFDARRVSLARIADLAGALLSGETTLTLRAGQAGLTWWRLRRWLPGMEEARAWASQATAAANGRGGVSPLDEITLANAPIRTHDHLAEISDRLRQVRSAAWTNAREPDRSIVTLRDFALVGLVANAAAAELHANTDPRRFVRAARQWQSLIISMRHLLAPGLPNPVVHAAVPQLRRLLADVARPEPGTANAREAFELRAPHATIQCAVAVSAEIAVWNATSFRTMAASGQIHVRARELTGDQVTNSPELVRAKLNGAVVTVPDVIRDAILTQYHDTRPRPKAPAELQVSVTTDARSSLERTHGSVASGSA
ncbi:hypothetical protein [Cellulomonas sp. Leaf395]|uniref:hypothetical protein n=1 Tax=Cellulomonas sp. Leaf395 TaxID=1736362 RepID=UPI0006FEE0EC|nr:hypothetical protein [Cellulomonas sp. Leaf395]KQT01304.1 hypothetical protein ASG23_06965 [Cellulomonas sp. Leaf395]